MIEDASMFWRKKKTLPVNVEVAATVTLLHDLADRIRAMNLALNETGLSALSGRQHSFEYVLQREICSFGVALAAHNRSILATGGYKSESLERFSQNLVLGMHHIDEALMLDSALNEGISKNSLQIQKCIDFYSAFLFDSNLRHLSTFPKVVEAFPALAEKDQNLRFLTAAIALLAKTVVEGRIGGELDEQMAALFRPYSLSYTNLFKDYVTGSIEAYGYTLSFYIEQLS